MSDMVKIVAGTNLGNTSFYYEATVNDLCHVKMSADVSAQMEEVAREHRFSKLQMRNLHIKMVAVRTFNSTLREYVMKLLLVEFNSCGYPEYRLKPIARNGNDPGKKGGGGSSGMSSEVLLNV